MDTSEELKTLLANMRMIQGFQNIAKDAMVELPIQKFPDRTWELVKYLQTDAQKQIESQIRRILGRSDVDQSRKANALRETEINSSEL